MTYQTKKSFNFLFVCFVYRISSKKKKKKKVIEKSPFPVPHFLLSLKRRALRTLYAPVVRGGSAARCVPSRTASPRPGPEPSRRGVSSFLLGAPGPFPKGPRCSRPAATCCRFGRREGRAETPRLASFITFSFSSGGFARKLEIICNIYESKTRWGTLN